MGSLTREAAKICYVAYRPELETNIEHISRYVSDQNYDVTILNISSEKKTDKIRQDGSRIKYIPLPNGYEKRKSKLKFIFEVANLLERNDFSIVHIESSCKYFGLLKLMAPKHKYIYHALSYPMYRKRWRVLLRLFSVLFQSSFLDSVIIQSEEQKDRWIGLRKLNKTQIVPIGFDHHLLYPIDMNKKENLRQTMGVNLKTPIIVYSGTMKINRKLDQLILAMKQVVRYYPDAILMMVGDDTTAGHLKKQIQELDLDERIIFTGRIPHNKMVEYYGVSDVGVSFIPINARYTYNPPLKTYEYLACGLPCVATETISNRRIIQNGKNGILVSDTPTGVAKGIITLLTDKQIQNELRKCAPSSVKTHSFQNVTHCYVLPLYKKLLDRH